MSGARPRGFRLGDRAELLAEFLLSSLAFTTPVLRQEDVGYDFLCVLARTEGSLVKAGPFFTIQVKSNPDRLVFEREYELEWITNQENPFFLGLSNREELSLELYSTWNMLNGFLLKGVRKVVLVPGEVHGGMAIETADDGSEQTIPLGRPIVRISVDDAVDEVRARALADVLREWVELDRRNIVHRSTAMYWVEGPIDYTTNLSLDEHSQMQVSFFWNPKNLPDCERNFGRAATALRLVVRKALGQEGEQTHAQRIADLEQALWSHGDCLGNFARAILREQVDLDLDEFEPPRYV